METVMTVIMMMVNSAEKANIFGKIEPTTKGSSRKDTWRGRGFGDPTKAIVMKDSISRI
jgi:hypothetical protein